MLELLIDLLLISFTVAGLIDVWLLGSIFANWRDQLEVRRYSRWWAELLLCRLCLSVWLVTFVGIVYFQLDPGGRAYLVLPAGVFLVNYLSRNI